MRTRQRKISGDRDPRGAPQIFQREKQNQAGGSGSPESGTGGPRNGAYHAWAQIHRVHSWRGSLGTANPFAAQRSAAREFSFGAKQIYGGPRLRNTRGRAGKNSGAALGLGSAIRSAGS